MNPTHSSSNPASSPASDHLSAERAKVLSLLEQGKITVEESADLLAALGSSKASSPPRPSRYHIAKRLTVIGVSLIIAGFFLPWFSVNPVQEMQRLAEQFSPMTGATVNIQSSSTANPFPMFHIMQVKGPDIGKGLGWMILFLGLAAAAIPFCFPGPQQKMFALVPLAVGIFMLLYLCSGAFHSIDFGFVVVSLGYLLELVGCLKWKSVDNPVQ